MKHTTRLTACLLALALTACTAAPQNMPAGTTTETATPPAQTAEPTTETPAVQDTLTPITRPGARRWAGMPSTAR